MVVTGTPRSGAPQRSPLAFERPAKSLGGREPRRKKQLVFFLGGWKGDGFGLGKPILGIILGCVLMDKNEVFQFVLKNLKNPSGVSVDLSPGVSCLAVSPDPRRGRGTLLGVKPPQRTTFRERKWTAGRIAVTANRAICFSTWHGKLPLLTHPA